MTVSASTAARRDSRVDPGTIRWRILRDQPARGVWNMAVDVALARSLGRDEGVLRIYRWSQPTLSVGRNQPARGRFDPSAAAGLGAAIVRRPTGGREVLHDRELTYSVAMPLRAFGGLRESYRIVNDALVQALRSVGVEAVPAPRPREAVGLDAGPCFAEPAEGEVTVAGRKLVGSAQARIGTALLQHGSILLAPPTTSIDALRSPPRPNVRIGGSGSSERALGSAAVPHLRRERHGISLAELLEVPMAFPWIASALEAAVAASVGGHWSRGSLRSAERGLAGELVSHYESAGWIWRR